MLDYSDFATERNTARIVAEVHRRDQFTLAHQVSVVMSEVKGDPRWKVYADHILAWKELCSARAESAGKKISDVRYFLSPEEYGRLKLETAYNQGKTEGLQGALDVIRDLIDKGKEPELSDIA